MSRPVIKFPPHHIQIEETLSEKENDLISVYSQPFHKSNPINSPPPPTLPPITTDEIFARHTQDTLLRIGNWVMDPYNSVRVYILRKNDPQRSN